MLLLLRAAVPLALALSSTLAAADPAADQKVVAEHVAASANATFRPPSGVLRYPYLVPAGPYRYAAPPTPHRALTVSSVAIDRADLSRRFYFASEMWDWDSLFMGVALVEYGSIPYFTGTFMNFLDHTNVTDGEVQGCITPKGSDGVIVHAKPVVLQGAWLSTKHALQKDPSGGAATLAAFKHFKPQMEALLKYWDVAPRRDPHTGLYVWHDQMQTGADDLVMSICPSKYSSCWNERDDAWTLASVDLQMFLYREHTAYARFCTRWAAAAATTTSLGQAESEALLAEAAAHTAQAQDILAVMEKYLWSEAAGVYVGRNMSSGAPITARTYLMGMPLWGGAAPAAHVPKIMKNLLKADMLSDWGIRSTSSADPRYSNANIITPYSNWRGPVWINVNAIIIYGMVAPQYAQQQQQQAAGLATSAAAVGRNASAEVVSVGKAALSLAQSVVHALAEDLRTNGTWCEPLLLRQIRCVFSMLQQNADCTQTRCGQKKGRKLNIGYFWVHESQARMPQLRGWPRPRRPGISVLGYTRGVLAQGCCCENRPIRALKHNTTQHTARCCYIKL
jgi:putative isomerase